MKVTQKTIDALSGILEEHLEVDIIAMLAERLGLSINDAMNIYYSSRLAQQISKGTYGIQFLSPSVLVDDLLENEPEFFLRE